MISEVELRIIESSEIMIKSMENTIELIKQDILRIKAKHQHIKQTEKQTVIKNGNY